MPEIMLQWEGEPASFEFSVDCNHGPITPEGERVTGELCIWSLTKVKYRLFLTFIQQYKLYISVVLSQWTCFSHHVIDLVLKIPFKSCNF